MSLIHSHFTTDCRTQDWAFTVKILNNPTKATVASYDVFFEHMEHYVTVIEKVPETTSGILHYHGMYNSCYNLYRKNLCLYGYHVCFKRIYNLIGWKKYMHKHFALHQIQEQVLKHCLFQRDSNFKFII